jgi:hypothetical protein
LCCPNSPRLGLNIYNKNVGQTFDLNLRKFDGFNLE